MQESIQFNLNGKSVSIKTDSDRSLLWVLRTDFNLTGTKYGCGEGFCGACTVLLNDEAVRSCQLTLKDVEGKILVTIEGLSQKAQLHPVQQAFVDCDAIQCGFCTPGAVLNAVSLLNINPNPTRNEIINEMDDNLCRCGAHRRILQAIEAVAQGKEGGPEK